MLCMRSWFLGLPLLSSDQESDRSSNGWLVPGKLFSTIQTADASELLAWYWYLQLILVVVGSPETYYCSNCWFGVVKVRSKRYLYFDEFLHGRERMPGEHVLECSIAVWPISLDHDGFLFLNLKHLDKHVAEFHFPTVGSNSLRSTRRRANSMYEHLEPSAENHGVSDLAKFPCVLLDYMGPVAKAAQV